MIITWKGFACGIYYLNNEDKVARHKHGEHTICLLQGSGEFEIYDGSGVVHMLPKENYILPGDVEHEIRATADNTIMIALGNAPQGGGAAEFAQAGGVLHDDGTIRYD